MSTLVGDTIHHYELVINAANESIDGLNWSIVSALDPDGATFTLTVTGTGNGLYDFSWIATKVGTYAVEAVTIGMPGGDEQHFIFSEDVDPIPTLSPVVVGPFTGPTLGDLRRAVARKVRDLLVLTATQSGSQQSLTDEMNLVANTDYYRGSEMLVISGDAQNVGLRRRVTASSGDALSISWVPALPVGIQEGDVVELYNHGSVRARITDYNNAINDAIAEAFPQNRVLLSQTLTDPFVWSVGTIDIPEPFIWLSSVEYQWSDGQWFPIYAAKDEGYPGWSIAPNTTVLTIRGNYAASADGRLIRLTGYGKEMPLVLDTDRTNTDREWVVGSAAASLTVGQLDQSTYPIGQNWANRADQLRAKMARSALPDTQRVR
jgi:hypothetical protein